MSWGVMEEGWRKGPWNAEEDKLLIEYVKLYGEGRWNSVARLIGLKRNGKSCRLRWVNYLRPDLKRGQITPHEESIILELHARWGNRWSTIARSLPGRTDNEIKNYWRTHFKKKTKSSVDDNSEKAKKRLLRRQQFQKQQQQQLQLQLQQQEEQLLQFNQLLDIKKIISLFEEDGYNSSSNSNSNEDTRITHVPQLVTTASTATCNADMTVEHHYLNVPNAMITNEDSVLWDGLWNLDVEGLENLGFATANVGCSPARKASFPNLVAPYC